MIRPILHQVLLKPYPSDEMSEGGIIVPDSCKKVSDKMKVVAVGSGTKSSPMKIKVGDTIFRVTNWGKEVEINGEMHYLMSQHDILAKLN